LFEEDAMVSKTHWAVAALLALAGCGADPEPVPSKAEASAPAAATAPAEPIAPAEPLPGEEPAEGPHDCAMGAGAELASDVVTKTTNAAGVEVLQVGAPLGKGPVVKLEELLAAPDAWAGKTVRVAGNVSAMCTHMRAWFAIATGDASGRYLRVLTAPAFLVPPESIGKSAEAEGVVEVVPLDPQTAAHLAGPHQLGDPAAPAGSAPQVLLRATGATFAQ
jgi:hypothetical protein